MYGQGWVPWEGKYTVSADVPGFRVRLASPASAGIVFTSESTTLKQRVRQLTLDNRTLQERLQAARSNVRFADRRIAQLEAQLLDHSPDGPGPLS